MPLKIYPFVQFNFGVFTKRPPNQIPEGAASDSLNWLTLQGKIELCRGYAIVGTEITTSSSPVTGLRAGQRPDGRWIGYATYDRKVRYYSAVTADWTEVGSNILPAAASGEDITISLFEGTAGKQVWINSPNTGPIKLNLVNPGDYISMYDSSKNYKGWMRFFDNRAYIWNIDNFDRTAVRLSYAEVRMRTDFSQAVAETVVNGGVVAQKTGNAKVSIFDISVTSGSETFVDDLNGVMVGSAGGSGTVNYQTGVIDITPAVGARPSSITATYRYVDETATWVTAGGATQGGIANFTVPTTRIANSPNIYQQGHGGDLVDIAVLNNHHFCMHKRSFFDIVQSQDDLTSSNTIYRDTLGILKLGGAFATAEGIYTIDTTDPVDQRFVIIEYAKQSADIKPRILSWELDLINYSFDKSVVFPYADYMLFACRTLDSSQNNRVFAYHRIFKRWDILDYCISCCDIFDDQLWAGDSLSPNVQKLFSGFDANGALIDNFWQSGISRLGFITGRGKPRIIYGQKKAKKLYIEGYISPTQNISVYLSLDRGEFIEVGSSDSAGTYGANAPQDQYSEANQNSQVLCRSTAFQTDQSQTFTVPQNTLLKSASLYLKKLSSPTGSMIAKIYATTGTNGVDAVPTGSPLATSDPLDASTVGLSFALFSFPFSGGNQIVLAPGTVYAVVFEYSNGSVTTAIAVGVALNTGTHIGNRGFSSDLGTTWTAGPTIDLCFYVYGTPVLIPPTHHPAIEGSGDYVDTAQAITIGSDMFDGHTIGGHPANGSTDAYHYARYIDLAQGKFEEVQMKLVCKGIGYCSVIRVEFRDIRVLQNKPSKKYRV